ncbi:MAG: NEL-type E3 ubiquitin ligase domain-containing protein [Limnobacter sp.]|nr:NEL-type E3 ubiquitin ligase domain-containing protein [Limnobacter sp.]
MPNRISQFFGFGPSRSEPVRNPSPQHPAVRPVAVSGVLAESGARSVQAGTQGLAASAQSSRRVDANINATSAQQAQPSSQAPEPMRRVDYKEVAHLSMADLRVGDEPDFDLVTIPRGRTIPQLIRQLNLSHPETDDLAGRDYLERIGSDASLGFMFRQWLKGRHVLGRTLMSDEVLENLTRKVQLVTNACRQSTQVSNSVELLATEAQSNCSDRSDYYLNAMWSQAALHALGGSARLNPVDLYNLGVANCRLNLLRNEVSALIRQHDFESVEAALHAEFALQDRLSLPISQGRPAHLSSSGFNEEIIKQLEHNVKFELLKDEGRAVTEFMSGWQPWVDYLVAQPRNVEQKNELTEAFQNSRDNFESERATTGTVANGLSDEEYQHKLALLGNQLNNWQRELAGQQSWQYRATERANMLMDSGRMPSAFYS